MKQTSPNSDTGEVDLGPTGPQLFHSFIWVVLGLLIGGFFVVATLFSQPQRAAIVIGAVICVLSVVSGVLEYLVLPGAVLVFGEEELVVRSRRIGIRRFPLAQIGYLSLRPGENTVEGAQRAAKTDTSEVGSWLPTPVTGQHAFSRRGRGLRRPHWYLELNVNSQGRAAGLDSLHLAVGGSRARVAQVQRACTEHGINFSAEG